MINILDSNNNNNNNNNNITHLPKYNNGNLYKKKCNNTLFDKINIT